MKKILLLFFLASCSVSFGNNDYRLDENKIDELFSSSVDVTGEITSLLNTRVCLHIMLLMDDSGNKYVGSDKFLMWLE